MFQHGKYDQVKSIIAHKLIISDLILKIQD